MQKVFSKFFSNFTVEPPASRRAIDLVEDARNIQFPEDYRSFLCESNGGEGFVGSMYVILWKAEELDLLNKEYEVGVYAPGLLLFGSSGGGEGFGFDTRCTPFHIVQVPFVGMSIASSKKVANSFSEFLERASVANGSLI